MKKILLTLALILCFALPVSALDLGLFDAEYPGINLTGDTLYIWTTGELAAGISTQLLSIEEGLISVDIQLASPVGSLDRMKYAGLIASLNIPMALDKVSSKLGLNIKLLKEGLQVQLGVGPLFNLEKISNSRSEVETVGAFNLKILKVF